MKYNFLTLALFFSIVIFISCSDDDESATSAYKFDNVDATGKINNVPFTYADGYADISNNEIRITLSLPQDNPGCAMFIPEGNQVFFTIDKAIKITALKFTQTESHTVTLFEADKTMNYIASKGAVEITEITDTKVSGRIDARMDSKTFVNGNFTVPVCQ
ncbi:hypothetical protein [Chryseosolibacter indicus]|uniref:Uncharacterized protein n=1 Tax=Chryseosolibacter indicus TaxID=2782351 RepID=A0ABS5VMY7_9BACT|nr:hypothetical protein [Chryseosolibacter indicus]MBT1702209.1 hypothetical protein [Chryseosolibacter indicus]